MVVAALAYSAVQVSRPPTLKQSHSRPVINADDVGRPPIFGTGPLVRVVQVVRDIRHDGKVSAVDPFTAEPLHPIAIEDAALMGNARYAIERYGYGEGKTRAIQLTFEDGPDPRFTPMLLDLLSRERIPATFCVLGENVARYPEIARRIVREGHALCNHSYSHADLSSAGRFRARAEMVLTDRIIRAATGTRVDYVRLPQAGADDVAVQSGIDGLLHAQWYGYQVAGYDFDTTDRAGATTDGIAMPPLSGQNLTVRMPDAGGRSASTLEFTERLIGEARANGYAFHTMPQVSAELAGATGVVDPTIWDKVALWGATAWSVWSISALRGALFLVLTIVVLVGLFNVLLAVGRRAARRRHPPPPLDANGSLVSVLIPAYNEEMVIARTVDAVRQSRYHRIEIVVVDDGSTDRTAEIVDGLARDDLRVRLIRQANSGKPGALNRGFHEAASDVVVTLDADTVCTPETLGNLVRHFQPTGDVTAVAAVAGVVKVGNRRNILTRWQALEYIVQIGVDRAAQSALDAVMTVPGACAAWDRKAVLRVGGFSDSTLTEDCDLTLTLQRAGYRVVQDDDAVAHTEVPETARQLAAQRLRWTFGNLHALWKHRRMLFRHGWLGLLVLPTAAVSLLCSIALLPVVAGLAVFTVREQGWDALVTYVVGFTVAQLVVASAGVLLLRERPSHLLVVPVYRLIQEPLRLYLMVRSLAIVLRGEKLRWNGVYRTGNVAIERRRVSWLGGLRGLRPSVRPALRRIRPRAQSVVASPTVRVAVLGMAGVVAVVAAAQFATGTRGGPPSIDARSRQPEQPAKEPATATGVVTWIQRNVPRAARVVVDGGLRDELVETGFPATRVVTYDQVDMADADTVEYVVTTGGDPGDNNDLRQKVEHARVVARFGYGPTRVEVSEVLRESVNEKPTDEEDAQARRRAGRELTTNPRLHLSAAARVDLRRGQVDSRLLSLLSLLASLGHISVLEFPVEAGEEGTGVPLRTVQIAEVADSSFEIDQMHDLVDEQQPPYRPVESRRVAVRGSLTLEFRYPATTSVGLIP